MSLLTPQEITNELNSISENSGNQKRELNSLKLELSSQRKSLSLIWALIAAILIAFFLTFILLGVDAWRFHGQKKMEYQQTLEKLKNENLELKIDKILSSKIDSFQIQKQDTTTQIP